MLGNGYNLLLSTRIKGASIDSNFWATKEKYSYKVFMAANTQEEEVDKDGLPRQANTIWFASSNINLPVDQVDIETDDFKLDNAKACIFYGFSRFLYRYLSNNCFLAAKIKLTFWPDLQVITGSPGSMAQINDKNGYPFVLSRAIVGFISLKFVTVKIGDERYSIMDYIRTRHQFPDRIAIGYRTYEVTGFAGLLAVGVVLKDPNIIGNPDKIGFVIEKSLNGEFARLVKYEDGPLKQHFKDGELEPERHNVENRQREDLTKFVIARDGTYICWDAFSLKQQREFLFRLFAINETLQNREVMEFLFWSKRYTPQQVANYFTREEVSDLFHGLAQNASRIISFFNLNYAAAGLHLRSESEQHRRLQAKYCGEVKSGKKNGFGMLVYANGTQYIGYFNDDECCGLGSLYLSDGTIYSGEFKANQPNGYGNVIVPRGRRYSGGFCKWLLTGTGTIYFRNGSTYSGEFANGLIHGKGKINYANGETYEGDWQNGEFHGQGTYAYCNGAVYQGDFRANNRHGKGSYFFPSNSSYLKYSGGWEKNEFNGDGKLIYRDGSLIRGVWRQGNFINGGRKQNS